MAENSIKLQIIEVEKDPSQIFNLFVEITPNRIGFTTINHFQSFLLLGSSKWYKVKFYEHGVTCKNIMSLNKNPSQIFNLPWEIQIRFGF